MHNNSIVIMLIITHNEMINFYLFNIHPSHSIFIFVESEHKNINIIMQNVGVIIFFIFYIYAQIIVQFTNILQKLKHIF